MFVDRNLVDHEEPYPSLSDYHDYEPNLEFDDTELQTSVAIADAASSKFVYDAGHLKAVVSFFLPWAHDIFLQTSVLQKRMTHQRFVQ